MLANLSLEFLVLGALVLGAIALLWRWGRAGHPRRRTLPVLLVALAAPAAVALAAFGLRGAPPVPEAEITNRPIRALETGYTSSDVCQSCHPREYAAWHRSYHRTMTQVATPATALGDFNGIDLQMEGKNYHLSKTADSLWVDIRDLDGTTTDRRQIVLSTGSHHDQNYWYEAKLGDRTLELLPFDWSRREGRWVPFASTFIQPPEVGHAVDPGMWNSNCIRCHTTRGLPRVTEQDGKLVSDTKVTEFGIACEACHGPAEAHVAANRNPLRRFAQHLSDEPDDTIVNPAKLPAKRSSEVCGRCHGISVERPSALRKHKAETDIYHPGDDINESRIYMQARYLDPDFKGPDLERRLVTRAFARRNADTWVAWFWPDGAVRVSGRDFTGMMESPCFERGPLECVSCHRLHKDDADARSLDQWADDMLQADGRGNSACTQCHTELKVPATLQAHTRHAPESSGSVCYDCHMPYTVYGIQKAIRSHRIEVPDVSLTVSTGRPNGCNQCHLDQSLAWTARYLNTWYGKPMPTLTEEQSSLAASVLWMTRGDPGQRALVAWSMGWKPAREASGEQWMVPLLSSLLEDPYDSVRFVAIHALREHEGFAEFPYDFVVPGDQQQDALRRAASLWAGRTAQPALGPAAGVLRDAAGQFQDDRLAELTEGRPNPPFYLLE